MNDVVHLASAAFIPLYTADQWIPPLLLAAFKLVVSGDAIWFAAG